MSNKSANEANEKLELPEEEHAYLKEVISYFVEDDGDTEVISWGMVHSAVKHKVLENEHESSLASRNLDARALQRYWEGTDKDKVLISKPLPCPEQDKPSAMDHVIIARGNAGGNKRKSGAVAALDHCSPATSKVPFSEQETACLNQCLAEYVGLKDNANDLIAKKWIDWARIGKGLGKKVLEACGTVRRDDECIARLLLNKRGQWSTEEEQLLLSLQSHLGNRWTLIGRLMGRSNAQSGVSNKFNALVKKQQRSIGTSPDYLHSMALLGKNVAAQPNSDVVADFTRVPGSTGLNKVTTAPTKSTRLDPGSKVATHDHHPSDPTTPTKHAVPPNASLPIPGNQAPQVACAAPNNPSDGTTVSPALLAAKNNIENNTTTEFTSMQLEKVVESTSGAPSNQRSIGCTGISTRTMPSHALLAYYCAAPNPNGGRVAPFATCPTAAIAAAAASSTSANKKNTAATTTGSQLKNSGSVQGVVMGRSSAIPSQDPILACTAPSRRHFGGNASSEATATGAAAAAVDNNNATQQENTNVALTPLSHHRAVVSREAIAGTTAVVDDMPRSASSATEPVLANNKDPNINEERNAMVVTPTTDADRYQQSLQVQEALAAAGNTTAPTSFSSSNPKGSISTVLLPFSDKETKYLKGRVVEFLKQHPSLNQCRSGAPWDGFWLGMGAKVSQACGTSRSDEECKAEFAVIRFDRLKTGSWSADEEEELVSLVGALGKRWSLIGRLLGRSHDNGRIAIKHMNIMKKKNKRGPEDPNAHALVVKRQKTSASDEVAGAKGTAHSSNLPSPLESKLKRFVEKVVEREELLIHKFGAHAAVFEGKMEDLEYVWNHKGEDAGGGGSSDTFQSVDSRGRNCLDLAAVLGKEEMVKWLLKNGMRFNKLFSYSFMMKLARGESWYQHD